MTELFPQRIRHVRSLAWTGDVAVPHTHEATYVLDEHGDGWVRKKVEQTGWEELLSECLSSLLAAEVQAPVPAGAVHLGTGEESFLSACVPHVVSHWVAARLAELQNLNDLGSVLALDVLVFNEDRHAGNILLAARDSGGLDCWGIDFGAALIGWPCDYASRVDDVPRGHQLPRDLPIDLLVESALQTAERLAGLSTDLVSGFAEEACALASSPDERILQESLRRRLEKLPDLVQSFLRQNGA